MVLHLRATSDLYCTLPGREVALEIEGTVTTILRDTLQFHGEACFKLTSITATPGTKVASRDKLPVVQYVAGNPIAG